MPLVASPGSNDHSDLWHSDRRICCDSILLNLKQILVSTSTFTFYSEDSIQNVTQRRGLLVSEEIKMKMKSHWVEIK